MRAWAVEFILPVLSAFLGVGGVLALGAAAADDLRATDRFHASFAAIQCVPAPPVGRDEFLREVQYQAELPDRLTLLDTGLPERLRAAFARHAWVENVERVEVSPRGAIRLRLSYRRPALALRPLTPFPSPRGGEGKGVRGRLRVVDGEGVLLPRAADPSGLPEYGDEAPPPVGPTGSPWGDPDVTAAARAVAFLLPHQDRLQITAARTEGESVVLRMADGSRIVWGSPPAHERRGEATAVLKRDRLLDYLRRKDAETPLEHDLRSAGRAVHRPLPLTVGKR